MIIANVSPARAWAGETRSTLQFAARAKHIRNKAVVNEDTRGGAEALRLEVVRLNRCMHRPPLPRAPPAFPNSMP